MKITNILFSLLFITLSSCGVVKEEESCALISCQVNTGSGSTTPTPSITSPAATVFYSKQNTLSLSGNCVNGAIVNLSGAGSQTLTCGGSAFQFTVTNTSDGSYPYAITQTVDGVTSSAALRAWVRDTIKPSSPSITTPSMNPYTSGESSFNLSGSCENGGTVTLLEGVTTTSKSCVNNSFSFIILKADDGAFTYSLTQTDLASNISNPSSFQWTRNGSNPPPTIILPSVNPFFSNLSTLSISGACSGQSTVYLGGFLQDSTVCGNSSYIFQTTASLDGVYNFSVAQNNGTLSSWVTGQWIRDTLVPVNPVFYGNNPFTSGDSTLSLNGNCEEGARVTLVSPFSQTTCSNGLFTFPITENCSESCNYTTYQSDKAGNQSSNTIFTWVKDVSMLTTPLITSPTAYTVYSSDSSLIINGTCTGSNLVKIRGDVIASEVTGGNLTKTCSSNIFSFTVNKSIDGTYQLSIVQADPVSESESATASRIWVRDTIAPTALSITNPVGTTYTAGGDLFISGNCEENATIILSGSSTNLSTTCGQGYFSLIVPKTSDGSYSFTLYQNDLAGNKSTNTVLSWSRISSIPPAPRILIPAINPISLSADDLEISGNCESGRTVTITGDFTGSELNPGISQTCVNDQFKYIASKTSDGIYNFNVKQSSDGTDSPAAAGKWVRDTSGPVVIISGISEGASNISYTTTLSFTVSPSEPVQVYHCKVDSGSFTPCTSPLSLELSNGNHSLQVKALDFAQNWGPVTTRNWTQAAGRTVALYHFNSGAVTTDNSNYSGIYKNPITSTTGSSSLNGQFSTLGLSIGNNPDIKISHTSSQSLVNSKMTVETWFNISSNLSNNTFVPLVSKSGSAPKKGWEVGLKRLGSKDYLIFRGSNDGSAEQELRSTSLDISNSTWYHFAVTYNKGSVTFFLNGTIKGSGSITGSLLKDLHSSNADIRLGSNSYSAVTFKGILDELRISQTLRYSSSFTPATSEFSAD